MFCITRKKLTLFLFIFGVVGIISASYIISHKSVSLFSKAATNKQGSYTCEQPLPDMRCANDCNKPGFSCFEVPGKPGMSQCCNKPLPSVFVPTTKPASTLFDKDQKFEFMKNVINKQDKNINNSIMTYPELQTCLFKDEPVPDISINNITGYVVTNSKAVLLAKRIISDKLKGVDPEITMRVIFVDCNTDSRLIPKKITTMYQNIKKNQKIPGNFVWENGHSCMVQEDLKCTPIEGGVVRADVADGIIALIKETPINDWIKIQASNYCYDQLNVSSNPSPFCDADIGVITNPLLVAQKIVESVYEKGSIDQSVVNTSHFALSAVQGIQILANIGLDVFTIGEDYTNYTTDEQVEVLTKDASFAQVVANPPSGRKNVIEVGPGDRLLPCQSGANCYRFELPVNKKLFQDGINDFVTQTQVNNDSYNYFFSVGFDSKTNQPFTNKVDYVYLVSPNPDVLGEVMVLPSEVVSGIIKNALPTLKVGGAVIVAGDFFTTPDSLWKIGDQYKNEYDVISHVYLADFNKKNISPDSGSQYVINTLQTGNYSKYSQTQIDPQKVPVLIIKKKY